MNSEPNKDFTDCECIDGTYLFSKSPLQCIKCPNHFTCDKGSTIKNLKIDKGYWRANITTLKIEKCKKGYNCLGKINNSSNDLCIKVTGPICDVCFEG